jgi:hypothetical protein
VHLRFKARQAGSLKHALQLSSDKTKALAFRSNGEPLRPALRWLQESQHQLVVFPNPVQQGGCWSLSPEEGTLQVITQQGILLQEQAIQKNIPTWINLKQAGVYLIKVIGTTSTWTEKVVVSTNQ